MAGTITDSQFYMWRTVFALAHADDVVTDEELRFMSEALEDIPFSDAQKTTLQTDAKEERSVEEMFEKITDPLDQAEFFNIASQIVHIDGDFGDEEQEVMLRLKRLHLQDVDIDTLIGKVDLSFEDDVGGVPAERDFKKVVHSSRQRFLQKIIG